MVGSVTSGLKQSLHKISPQISSEDILKNWITRFGCPLKITTDQGNLSQLFIVLKKILGAKRIRTNLITRRSIDLFNDTIVYCSMKAALRATITSNKHWIYELHTIVLGLRAVLRTWHVSLCRRTNVRPRAKGLPSDFFTETSAQAHMDNDYVSSLRRIISSLKPVRAQLHNNKQVTSVHPDLQQYENVFVRVDTVRKPL